MQKTIQPTRKWLLMQRVMEIMTTGYFFTCVGFLGSLGAYLITGPLYLLSRIAPALLPLADFLFCCICRTLFLIQPTIRLHSDVPKFQALRKKYPGRKIFIVANHRSHLDVFLLISLIPGLRILAKESLFRIPFLGLFMRLMGDIPLKQGRLDAFIEALQIMKYRLNKGHFVLAFPELTRSPKSFAGIQPFRPAVFQAPLETGALVLPLVIKGSGDIWPKKSSFLAPGEVTISMLAPLDSRNFSTSAELCKKAAQLIEAGLK